MKQNKGLSPIEVIVLMAILFLLFALLMPPCGKVKNITPRVVCGTNLHGIGQAMTTYSSNYDGEYPCQGGGYNHMWAEFTDGWMNEEKDWSQPGNITVSASLYLLVRQADVSPKSFVCPASEEIEFSGKNPKDLDIVELWDFGQASADPVGRWRVEGPAHCVSLLIPSTI